MRKVIESTPNWTKRDTMNLTSAQTLQDLAKSGDRITIESAALIEVTDEETGEIKKSIAIKSIDSRTFVGISSTALEQGIDIIDYIKDLYNDPHGDIKDEDMVSVQMIERTSRNGRAFLVMDIR